MTVKTLLFILVFTKHLSLKQSYCYKYNWKNLYLEFDKHVLFIHDIFTLKRIWLCFTCTRVCTYNVKFNEKFVFMYYTH